MEFLLLHDKMKNTYYDLIEKTYHFPQASFEVKNNQLLFNNIPLMQLLKDYGSPLKLTYLPKIASQIQRARTYFRKAMQKCAYAEDYMFAYCTKSSHFSYILDKVLEQNAQLELSSAVDTQLVIRLVQRAKLSKETYIICNGYKNRAYIEGIRILLKMGFKNTMPILDSEDELESYLNFEVDELNLGLRMAVEEKPRFLVYTSRFGIRKDHLIDFYKEKIKPNPKFRLKMLHAFIYTGIQDITYYWNELYRFIKMYVQLKQVSGQLDMINIGGGLPIQNALDFEYNYQYMCDEIVAQIKNYCNKKRIREPKLFSEFGSFAVGESGALLLNLLGVKKQNDRETWYIVDNSFISTLPDIWAKKQNFILLPLNKWEREYQRVNLGGLTCDNDDFYGSSKNEEELFLPIVDGKEREPLAIGFFHTGAYQDSLSGFGGVHHCLIPSPKHILIDLDTDNRLSYRVFREEQNSEYLLNLLGY